MSEALPLREVVSPVNDKVTVGKDPTLPYVGLEHLPSRGSSLLGFAPAETSVSTNGVFAKWDVLFGKLRPNLRKSLSAPFDGYCSTDILILRAREGIDPAFAGRLFQSEAVGAAAERSAIGTKMPRTSWRSLKEEVVFVPPRREQATVAHILDTLDTQIRRTEALIAKLERIKQGLLTDLLTRGIDDNGQLRPPPEQAPHLYKDSPLGRLPVGWQVLELGALARSSVIGPFGSDLVADDYRTEGVPVVFVRDIKSSGFQWNSDVYVTHAKAAALAAHAVWPGDIVLTKMGLPPCLACVYPDWMPEGVVTADIIRVRVDVEQVRPAWIAAYANADPVVRQVAAITGGVTRPKVTLRDARGLRIAVPSVDEQDRVLAMLERVDSRTVAEIRHRDDLFRMKAGLVDDLLTGRVRVTPLLDKPGVAAG